VHRLDLGDDACEAFAVLEASPGVEALLLLLTMMRTFDFAYVCIYVNAWHVRGLF
jgi:hypothetical protein